MNEERLYERKRARKEERGEEVRNSVMKEERLDEMKRGKEVRNRVMK